MDWNRLLSTHRVPRNNRDSAPATVEEFRSPFEADADRIVYSAPFRRLARKTQVHPFAANDHVHNRLTHSIEVASVGRGFGRRLGQFLERRGQLPANGMDQLCQVLQAACLAHDIGNPPFGHAGEFAIREWIRVKKSSVFEVGRDSIQPGVQADWQHFEGNAQGFRLAARSDNPKSGYMRLTFATLATMVKYPWDSLDPRTRAIGKCNAFSTEKHILQAIATNMELERADGSIARHPLSFLCEAADDICYRILDVEDAVNYDILNEQEVRELFYELLMQRNDDLPLAQLRGRVIVNLMSEFWKVFVSDYDGIMAGTRVNDLKADANNDARTALKKVKFLYERIFAHRTKVAVELGAYEVLGRIIEMLAQATQELARVRKLQDADFLTQRRLELIWGSKYATANEHQPYEWWLHQVMDYVSGLTDNYARQVSGEIAGL